MVNVEASSRRSSRRLLLEGVEEFDEPEQATTYAIEMKTTSTPKIPETPLVESISMIMFKIG